MKYIKFLIRAVFYLILIVLVLLFVLVYLILYLIFSGFERFAQYLVSDCNNIGHFYKKAWCNDCAGFNQLGCCHDEGRRDGYFEHVAGIFTYWKEFLLKQKTKLKEIIL